MERNPPPATPHPEHEGCLLGPHHPGLSPTGWFFKYREPGESHGSPSSFHTTPSNSLGSLSTSETQTRAHPPTHTCLLCPGLTRRFGWNSLPLLSHFLVQIVGVGAIPAILTFGLWRSSWSLQSRSTALWHYQQKHVLMENSIKGF